MAGEHVAAPFLVRDRARVLPVSVSSPPVVPALGPVVVVPRPLFVSASAAQAADQKSESANLQRWGCGVGTCKGRGEGSIGIGILIISITSGVRIEFGIVFSRS